MAAPTSPGPSSVVRPRPHVLVIDDDDAIRELMGEVLTRDGYAVATARHGEAALELLRHIRPAVVVLDLQTPRVDGDSFVDRYLLMVPPAASIVMLSALPGGEQEAQRLGAHAYLEKPFDLEVLKRMISGSLARG